MKLNEKQQIVKDIAGRFSRAKVVIVTDYKGLDVEAMNDLRAKLREAEVEYRVVKNTLLVRAAEGTDVSLITDAFKGPNGVALSYEDPVAPAKVLTKFAKDQKKLDIKIGVLDGKVLSFEDIKALADLPPREALLGQLLSVMNGVPASFVRTLSGVPAKFVNVLQAIKDKKEAA